MVNKSKFSLDAMTKKLGKILDQYVPAFSKETPSKGDNKFDSFLFNNPSPYKLADKSNRLKKCSFL